jgi:hypothetical protein
MLKKKMLFLQHSRKRTNEQSTQQEEEADIDWYYLLAYKLE